jgi:short-subunit dehydrogenase
MISEARMRKTEVVVITGASAGVGRATVQAFARRGARIGLIARNREALEAAQREAAALGGEGIVCVADVSRAHEIEAAAAAVEARFGPIDTWVNNAMVTIVSPVKELLPEEVRHATEVTYLGTVYGTLAALKRMSPRNRGSIVQVGSALAYRAIPIQAPYCGAKFAIRGFTDALRSELIRERSRVHLTMVQLPALNTPQFEWCKTRMSRQPQPVPPIYQPEVAARAIVWAAHHRRREVWVGASALKAIWANKLVPGLIDRYLAGAGYSSQLTGEPVTPDRADNFWAPVAGDHGAHGRFDARASASSPELWLSTHRGWIAAAALGIAAAAMRLRARRRD